MTETFSGDNYVVKKLIGLKAYFEDKLIEKTGDEAREALAMYKEVDDLITYADLLAAECKSSQEQAKTLFNELMLLKGKLKKGSPKEVSAPVASAAQTPPAPEEGEPGTEKAPWEEENALVTPDPDTEDRAYKHPELRGVPADTEGILTQSAPKETKGKYDFVKGDRAAEFAKGLPLVFTMKYLREKGFGKAENQSIVNNLMKEGVIAKKAENVYYRTDVPYGEIPFTDFLKASPSIAKSHPEETEAFLFKQFGHKMFNSQMVKDLFGDKDFKKSAFILNNLLDAKDSQLRLVDKLSHTVEFKEDAVFTIKSFIENEQ